MNSGVLFALLLCLGCGLWIGAEACDQRSGHPHRCPAGWTPFQNRCVKFFYHHPHHHLYRCPAGWTLFNHRCVKFSHHRPHHRPHHHPHHHPHRFLPVPHCRCPSGWSRYGNRCFLFINSDRDWNNAENFCRIIGGHLASFHSYGELNFLRNLVYRSTGSFRNTWVGGTDIIRNRVWRWTDGSHYNYNHWYSGEPNNWMGREPCMEINFRGSDGNNDERCYASRPFICSRRC